MPIPDSDIARACMRSTVFFDWCTWFDEKV